MQDDARRSTLLPVALTLCNLAVALTALIALESWQHPDQATALGAVAPFLSRPQRRMSPAAHPVVYFVASQKQADTLEKSFAISAVATAAGAPYKIVVVTTETAARRLRRAHCRSE